VSSRDVNLADVYHPSACSNRVTPTYFNLNLSLRRARNVESALSLFLAADSIVNPPGPTPRTSVGAQGEQFAANLNVKDGTEDA